MCEGRHSLAAVHHAMVGHASWAACRWGQSASTAEWAVPKERTAMAERGEEMRQGLLAAVARIRPEIERASGEGETLMTLPASSVDLLTESGLLRIKLPEVLGGLEADLITQFEVIEAMAYADAAAAWCLMIGATCTALPGAYLPDGAVEEIFRGPGVPRAAGILAPTGSAHRGEGGYTLSGRSAFASGVRESE